MEERVDLLPGRGARLFKRRNVNTAAADEIYIEYDCGENGTGDFAVLALNIYWGIR